MASPRVEPLLVAVACDLARVAAALVHRMDDVSCVPVHAVVVGVDCVPTT